MASERMDRRASDNEYLHKDFHGALSSGISYLEDRFGADAVRQYLREFALSYYAPLREDVRTRGLEPLKHYFEKMYRVEGGKITTKYSAEELVIEVESCPAVTHMRSHGYPVARLFSETTKTVNEAICEGTPFQAELVSYEEETGRSVQRFSRRRP